MSRTKFCTPAYSLGVIVMKSKCQQVEVISELKRRTIF